MNSPTGLASRVAAAFSAVILPSALLMTACTSVGPDYVRPDTPMAPAWYSAEVAGLSEARALEGPWWELMGDADLNRLVTRAQQVNNTLEIAALRVLEARAQLGIAVGAQYPQTQVAAGGATASKGSENAANTTFGDLKFTQYDVGVTAAWEIDFWGRFRRGIEAADAAYLGSVAAYDQAMLLVTAQVALTYVAIRTLEEQLRITGDNIAAQQRSYDIVEVRYRNGDTSELDVLQARTLLLSTQATVPELRAELRQAKHALSTLLGTAPGPLDEWLQGTAAIPSVPQALPAGVPAELLRRRPDVREAEFVAMAQNASVGLATADLYPSFSISGSLGLVAADRTDSTRTGNEGLRHLFDTDSFTYSVGPSFVWPFLNYGRIRNNIRVQDARLQQALTAYRETVIQAAREVEDAAVALAGARERSRVLSESVQVAQRSADVALLRFREGFAGYQRVLDAQQALFAQQGRYVASLGDIAAAYIALQIALGEGWQAGRAPPLIPDATRETMTERVNWSDMIERTEEDWLADPSAASPAAESTGAAGAQTDTSGNGT